MRTLLSFLGTGPYERVTYIWSEAEAGAERQVTTDLFPEAAARLFRPDRVLLGVTETVRDSENFRENFRKLQERIEFEPLPIPEGRSEQELWELFDRVAKAVGEGETLLLDVTHALRSLPLMAFTVAAYLRRAKRVTVERIVYGAYEAREPSRDPTKREQRVPVFDLTPLLDLLDWLSGAEAFLERGDARTLAQKLRETQGRLWRTSRDQQQEAGGLPQKIQRVATKLDALARALQLSRPREAMREADALRAVLAEAVPEVERWTQPFAVILERTRAEAERLAHREPDRLDAETLRKQWELIEYALDKGWGVSAVLMAREWVVNWAALHHGEGDWLKREYREHEIERALSAAARALHDPQAQAEVPEWVDALPQGREVAGLWDWLGDLRNDVAHCGYREQAASLSSLEGRTQELPRRLKPLLDGSEIGERALHGGRVVLDLSHLYEGETAKLDELPLYLERAKEQAGEGQEVVLTGPAPIWLYLAVAHALHGRARRLVYGSPVTGEVLVFDHTAR